MCDELDFEFEFDDGKGKVKQMNLENLLRYLRKKGHDDLAYWVQESLYDQCDVIQDWLTEYSESPEEWIKKKVGSD